MYKLFSRHSLFSILLCCYFVLAQLLTGVEVFRHVSNHQSFPVATTKNLISSLANQSPLQLNNLPDNCLECIALSNLLLTIFVNQINLNVPALAVSAIEILIFSPSRFIEFNAYESRAPPLKFHF